MKQIKLTLRGLSIVLAFAAGALLMAAYHGHNDFTTWFTLTLCVAGSISLSLLEKEAKKE